MFILFDTAIPQLPIYPKQVTRNVQRVTYKNIYTEVEDEAQTVLNYSFSF